MELTYEDGDTQISLTWSTLDQKRVKQNYCEACTTKEMINSTSLLVEELLGNKGTTKDDERIAAKKREIEAQKEDELIYERQQIAEEKRKIAAEKRRLEAKKVKARKFQTYDKKPDNTKNKFRGLTGSGQSAGDNGDVLFSINSLYFVLNRWGFGITDLSASPQSSDWRFKNRSLDLSYDLNYSILNDLNLTVGIGYILEGEAAKENSGLITNEVSGYRLISFLSKSFGDWALIGGYLINNYDYNIYVGAGEYG